jgi:hypothetical protein
MVNTTSTAGAFRWLSERHQPASLWRARFAV